MALTRVVKCNSRPQDAHKDGDLGMVMGSLGPIPFEGDPEVYGYFVRWDDLPGQPVFVTGNRVQAVPE